MNPRIWAWIRGVSQCPYYHLGLGFKLMYPGYSPMYMSIPRPWHHLGHSPELTPKIMDLGCEWSPILETSMLVSWTSGIPPKSLFLEVHPMFRIMMNITMSARNHNGRSHGFVLHSCDYERSWWSAEFMCFGCPKIDDFEVQTMKSTCWISGFHDLIMVISWSRHLISWSWHLISRSWPSRSWILEIWGTETPLFGHFWGPNWGSAMARSHETLRVRQTYTNGDIGVYLPR